MKNNLESTKRFLCILESSKESVWFTGLLVMWPCLKLWAWPVDRVAWLWGCWPGPTVRQPLAGLHDGDLLLTGSRAGWSCWWGSPVGWDSWQTTQLAPREKERDRERERESWRRCSRMWSSSLPTNASRIHLRTEQFSQSTCWTLAEDFGHLKGQERSPCNQVGWKKEDGKRKRRGSRMGPAPPVGRWRWGNAPASGEPPSPAGRSAGTEGEPQGLEGEPSNQSAAGRTEWDLHRWSVPCPVHPSLRWASASAHGGWGLQHEVWKQTWGGDCCWPWRDSLRGQEWGAPQQRMFAEEAWTSREARSHGWVTRKEQGCHFSLSSHALAPASTGTREGSHRSWLTSPCHRLLHTPTPSLGNTLALIAAWWALVFKSLPTEQLACPDPRLGSFLPDGLLCSSNLWSRLRREKHTQRWGWNHSWVPGAAWLRKKS